VCWSSWAGDLDLDDHSRTCCSLNSISHNPCQQWPTYSGLLSKTQYIIDLHNLMQVDDYTNQTSRPSDPTPSSTSQKPTKKPLPLDQPRHITSIQSKPIMPPQRPCCKKRHTHSFWVYPYTRTLCSQLLRVVGECSFSWLIILSHSWWCSACAIANSSHWKCLAIDDHNAAPSGLSSYSLMIQTPNQEIKITVRLKERHELWLSVCP
jgi:hypothetical protein